MDRFSDFFISKVLLVILIATLIFTASSSSMMLFGILSVIAFLISKERFYVLKFTFFAVFIFSFFVAFINGIFIYYLTGQIDLTQQIIFVWRSFVLTYLTISFINRFGIVGVFGITKEIRLFIVLFLAKKELFIRILKESYEAAASRGMNTKSFSDTLRLIASLAVTLFHKALLLSKENNLALRSRGYYG